MSATDTDRPATTAKRDWDSQHVIFIADNYHPTKLGHIVELFNPLAGGHWESRDLTEDYGLPPAAINTNIVQCAWTDSQSMHIVYMGNNGHLYEVWQYLSGTFWSHKDLTNEARAPIATTTDPGLTACFDPFRNHVFYVSEDRHVQELSCDSKQPWVVTDLTASRHVDNAPLVHNGATLTSWVDPTHVHLGYVSGKENSDIPDRGHVQELYTGLYQEPTQADWYRTDLTAQAATRERALPFGPLTSWVSPGSAANHVAFISEGNHLIQIYKTSVAAPWQAEDLTGPINAPIPSTGPSAAGWLTSWADFYHDHVIYVSLDSAVRGHVQELYRPIGETKKPWTRHDFTAEEPHAPTATINNGPSLTSWVTGSGPGYKHVAYVSGDHVHELACDLTDQQTWGNNSLTNTELRPRGGLKSWSDIAMLPDQPGRLPYQEGPGHPTLYTFRVPNNVRALDVVAAGGTGGKGSGNSGGPGSAKAIEGTAPVIPGEVINFVVGGWARGGARGPGFRRGGWGGKGGDGVVGPGSGKDGGGGGGSTSLFGTFSGQLFEAAGGGGAGGAGGLGADGGNGGQGGLNPGNGTDGQDVTFSKGGKGGAGGAGGQIDGSKAAGTAGGGGGGGGGYPSGGYGGATGSTAGGGGGGGGRTYIAAGFRLTQELDEGNSFVEVRVLKTSGENPS